MTKEQAINILKELQVLAEREPEEAHIKADKVLCDFLNGLGFVDVVEEYDNVLPKWFN